MASNLVLNFELKKTIKYIKLDCPDDARHNAENLNNQSHLNPLDIFLIK